MNMHMAYTQHKNGGKLAVITHCMAGNTHIIHITVYGWILLVEAHLVVSLIPNPPKGDLEHLLDFLIN